MRKLYLTTILTLLISSISIAQSWVDFGLKGGWGMTMLFNQKIFDDQSVNHQISFAPNYGLKIGYNFGQEHEVTFDVMFSQFKQDFAYNISDTSSGTELKYTSSFQYKSTDFLLMYRHNNNGSYFEIGPKFSLINSSSNNFSLNTVSAFYDPSHIQPSITSLALGFGSYFVGTENFGITGGLRLSYSFSDVISANGRSVNAPTYMNMDNGGTNHPLFVQLIFEANYDLAYMAKAKCGRRKILMF